jgi:hypothetical protein
MQRGGELSQKKNRVQKFKKNYRARAAARRVRGGDEATTFTAFDPLRQAP